MFHGEDGHLVDSPEERLDSEAALTFQSNIVISIKVYLSTTTAKRIQKDEEINNLAMMVLPPVTEQTTPGS
jgi:hypothetical protein